MPMWQRYLETRLPSPGDPLRLAARLARSGLFPQYVIYEKAGNWYYAGGAAAELTLSRTQVTVTHDGRETTLPWTTQPLSHVHRCLSALPLMDWRAYGWASFELSYALSGSLDDTVDSELLHLVVPVVEVRIGPGEALLRGTDHEVLDQVCGLLADPFDDRPDATPVPVEIHRDRSERYRTAVAAAVSAIADGTLRKVILSRTVEVEHEVDLVDTYLAGRRANTPARSFLLNLGRVEAAGFSPETVVEVSADGLVSTQPLAGTRALTRDDATNAQLRAELLADPKEVYEHAISVQVAWDEMTEVCEHGSVRVEEFMGVRQRGSVQHIASRVTGRLKDRDHGPWGGLAAVFPAVTASGVPKAAAYDVIRQHEQEPRGLYSGAVLTLDSTGELDAALVLRTVFRSGGRTWLRAGAGIVGQSHPEREYEETCEKLRSVSRFLVPAGLTSLRPSPPVATPSA